MLNAQSFLGQFLVCLSRLIIRWPVVHFIEQTFLAIAAEEDVEMSGFRWCDVVVAKLDVFKPPSIGIVCFKKETDATVAFA